MTSAKQPEMQIKCGLQSQEYRCSEAKDHETIATHIEEIYQSKPQSAESQQHVAPSNLKKQAYQQQQIEFPPPLTNLTAAVRETSLHNLGAEWSFEGGSWRMEAAIFASSQDRINPRLYCEINPVINEDTNSLLSIQSLPQIQQNNHLAYPDGPINWSASTSRKQCLRKLRYQALKCQAKAQILGNGRLALGGGCLKGF